MISGRQYRDALVRLQRDNAVNDYPAYMYADTCQYCSARAIWRIYPRVRDVSGYRETCQQHLPHWKGARRFYLPKLLAKETARLLLEGDST